MFELGEEGYPTEATIEAVRSYTGPVLEFFEQLHLVWCYAKWGWKQEVGYTDSSHRKRIARFHISTAGRSGNEDLMDAMEDNFVLWSLSYVQHRVGGHYIFEVEKDSKVYTTFTRPRLYCENCEVEITNQKG